MATVNLPIPSLANGVSQQAASVRSPSQLAAQDNAWSSLVDGLTKRPPLEHIANLSALSAADLSAGAFIHEINRDVSERYAVVLLNGDLLVYNLETGAPVTCTFPDGKAYLTSTAPATLMSAVTVADYTFIINKAKTVALETLAVSSPCTITIASPGVITPTNPWIPGAYTYPIGTEVVFTTTGALPTGLTAGVTYYVVAPTGSNFFSVSATPGGAAINTSTLESGTHTITAPNGLKQTGIVQSFDKLPATPPGGDLWKITGNVTNPFDNYYVTWNGSVWIEAIRPGLQNSYDDATMPHTLVRQADGTFIFSKATWDARTTGDADNSPPGAFVGRTISEILFHRNRLGLVSDESVVFSRAGKFFNFFRSTATQILDTDPVHTAVSHSKVSILRHAVAFDKQTVLFSDQTQFALTAGDALTPTTTSIAVSTEFECSKIARPVASGPNLYFAADRGAGTVVREYFVQDISLSNDAADVTAHCPTYIPAGVFKMAASTSQDVVACISSSAPNEVFFYKFYWRGDEKVQSSWSKWTLEETDTILSMTVVSSVFYFLIKRGTDVFLEKVDIQQGLIDADVGVRVHLDRRVSLTGSYDSGTGLTTWTLPYTESAELQLVLRGTSFPTQRGAPLTITRPSSSTVAAVGDYSAGPVFIGRKYTMRVQLSEPFMRDRDSAPVLDGRLQIKRLHVRYANSGSFRVEVTPSARTTNTYAWNGKRLGDVALLIGSPSVASGTWRVPVMSRSDRVIVELVNDSYLPSAFQSAEWVTEFTPKSKRL